MARVEASASFRIGKQDNFYEFYALINVQINDKPVYRCIRDKDNGKGLLFLYYHTDEAWISVSADRWASSEEDIVKGIPAFRAATNDEIREEGNYDWYMCNKYGVLLYSSMYPFGTTVFKRPDNTECQRKEASEPEAKRPRVT